MKKRAAIMQTLSNLFAFLGEDESGESGEAKERALTISQMYSQIDSQIWNDGYWVIDIYADEGPTLYAITSREGKLYQFPFTIEGSDVVMGEPVEVEHTFTPVGDETRMYITRQADGRRRLNVIASTAVLNRVGEIDSRDLYDDFIKNREKEGNPYWTILHCGEVCRFGEIDGLYRDDYIYVNSGLLDEDNVLADAVADAVTRGDLALGISIGFTPTAPPTYEEIATNVKVPVYRSGIHRESSILFENTAAALFTNVVNIDVERKRTMSKALEDFLGKLGVPADKATELAGQVDDTNRAINKDGMIARNADVAPVADPAPVAPVATPAIPDAPPAAAVTPSDPAPAGTPVEATLESATIEISDVMMAELVKKVAEQVGSNLVKSMEVVVNQSKESHRIATESQQRVAALEADLKKERDARAAAEGRLANLEKPEEQKRQQYQADMPRRSTVTLTRARVDRDTGAVTEVADLAASAAQTLSNLPGRIPAPPPIPNS